MYSVRVWNKNSTDFGANPFIAEHGTGEAAIETQKEALQVMGSMIRSPSIDKAILRGPEGCLVWCRVREEDQDTVPYEEFEEDADA